MFDFLKIAQNAIVTEEETGTYADAFLQMPDMQVGRIVEQEYGHESHKRDYGASREIARNSLGFA